jgi:hypothetical protein
LLPPPRRLRIYLTIAVVYWAVLGLAGIVVNTRLVINDSGWADEAGVTTVDFVVGWVWWLAVLAFLLWALRRAHRAESPAPGGS